MTPEKTKPEDDKANNNKTKETSLPTEDGKGASSPSVTEEQEACAEPVGAASLVAGEGAVTFDKLGENDVLLGRGAPLVKLEGNRRFRTLIEERQTSYLACTHHSEKETLAKEVLDIVSERSGRFWKRRDGSKDMWLPVDSSIAMEKVKQAFRDNGSKRKSSHHQAGGTNEVSNSRRRYNQSPDEAEVQRLNAQASFLPQVSSLRNNAAAIFTQNRANFLSGNHSNDLDLIQRAQEAERQQLWLSQMALMQHQPARGNPLMGPMYSMDQLLLERQILAHRAAEQQLLTQQLLVERQLAAQAAMHPPFLGGPASGFPGGSGIAIGGGMHSDQRPTMDRQSSKRDKSSPGRSLSSK